MTDTHQTGSDHGGRPRPFVSLKCDEIQSLLTGYMTRELGDSQSALVREHLRRCEACRNEAQQIQETLSLLQSSGEGEALPDRLSDRRRRRMMRAITHPVIGWIEDHRLLVCLAAGLLAIALAVLWLMRLEAFDLYETPEGVQVIWLHKPGTGPTITPPEVAPGIGRADDPGTEIYIPARVATNRLTFREEAPEPWLRIPVPSKRARWGGAAAALAAIAACILLLRRRRRRRDRDPDKTPENGPPFAPGKGRPSS